MGSTILDHAIVGEGAIVAAGSLVLSNTVIEPGSKMCIRDRLAVSYSTCEVLIVIPLYFSSGALSIESKERNSERPFFANTVVIAAVNVVLPWST